MNSDACEVTHWLGLAFLKNPLRRHPFVPSPSHFVLSNLYATIDSASRLVSRPRVLIGLTDCGGAVGGVGSGLRGLLRWRLAGRQWEASWERWEERGGFIPAHVLCAAAPVWCTQQQPAPLCVCTIHTPFWICTHAKHFMSFTSIYTVFNEGILLLICLNKYFLYTLYFEYCACCAQYVHYY